MQWKNIQDERPAQNSVIVQLDETGYAPYDSADFKGLHYGIGMRKYVAYSSWEEYVEWCKSSGSRIANYWWVYAKDFPFPLVSNEVQEK